MARIQHIGSFFLTLVVVATPVSARSNLVVQPVQIGAETVRYYKGAAMLDLIQSRGVIQVEPGELQRGSVVFNIAVYNDSDRPANFDTGNIRVSSGDKELRVFSRHELVKKAENRAFWSQMGVAALGGVAAGLTASQRDTYHSAIVTPYGVSHGYYSAPSVAGQIQSTAIMVGTGLKIHRIQQRLDQVREELRHEVIQTTTVDPGESYGGMIVVEKIKASALPQPVRLTINWNGEDYHFAFQLAKAGAPAPVFTNLTPPVSPPSASPTPLRHQPALEPASMAPALVMQTSVVPVTTTSRPPEPVPTKPERQSASASRSVSAPVMINRSYEINVGGR